MARSSAFPQLNAEIQGDEIVLKHYYDIGMAVGVEGGLVVPVIRDADTRSFAEIELAIRDFARRAQDGSLTLEDLKGGTFTITNGGVFGSLMSTPILNPPQVGILGLHKISDRPVAVNGQVVIRPMMYLALSYDHRIVDGREAVQFLVKIKEFIEDPALVLIGCAGAQAEPAAHLIPHDARTVLRELDHRRARGFVIGHAVRLVLIVADRLRHEIELAERLVLEPRHLILRPSARRLRRSRPAARC